jgi:hypothetical protein
MKKDEAKRVTIMPNTDAGLAAAGRNRIGRVARRHAGGRGHSAEQFQYRRREAAIAGAIRSLFAARNREKGRGCRLIAMGVISQWLRRRPAIRPA